MARRNDFLIPALGVVFDSLAIECAFLAAYWLRFKTSLLTFLPLAESTPPLGAYLYGSLVIIPIWLLLFNSRRMYGARRNVGPADEFFGVVRLVTLGMLVVMSGAFFYRAFSYSRVVFGLLWLFSIVLISAGRAFLYRIEKKMYKGGRGLRNAVIVGNNAGANQVYSHLHNHPLLGYTFIGYFADRSSPASEPLGSSLLLGRMDDLQLELVRLKVELVLVAVGADEHQRLSDIVRECEGLNVEFMMVPDFLEMMTSKMAVTEIEGIPFVRLKGVAITPWGRILKRSLDLIFSGALLTLLLPVMLVVALAIKLGSAGPVLFVQERIGIDGIPFRMLKFRSMVEGAEKQDHRSGLGLPNDPRRTAVGKFLRRTSLDEFPQLLNVLKGEMSLVGPRPERPYYVDRFKTIVPKYLDRQRVKTGMTGWAQVNGLRGDSSLEERIKYDLYYIENWSFGLDLRILLRTLRALIE